MGFEETLVTLIEEHDFTPVFEQENDDGSMSGMISRVEEIGEVQRITSVCSRAGYQGLFFDVALQVKGAEDQQCLLDEIAYTLNLGSIFPPWTLGVWGVVQPAQGLIDLTHNYYWHATEELVNRIPDHCLEGLCVDTIKDMEECAAAIAQLVSEVFTAYHVGYAFDIPARIATLADLLEPQGQA